ncbi:glycine betaine ABC transporter substrate-binding protein [Glaciibacter superstes]|uniref:glycine betaine ABC transporter substrate-binding protein n=1 Tax=Glaciibacter superstes TaxID=501023 RepID=UPI0003B3C0E2|nr:glycine betaine ABC transporter substrate-binding protein [Glaciibacter superstes]
MKKRLLTGLALGAMATLGLTACAAGGSGESSDGPANGDKKDLTIAVFNGWPEGEAVSYLWKSILDEKGYDVTLEYADAAPTYTGISAGDYDMVMDTWLPITHKTYMEKYGDDLVDLGVWNTEAANTIAVNADAPIDSLEELAAHADEFGNRIVGIEPGAGLTEATENEVIPGYGLEKMEYLTSSTPAMLSELKAATDAGENIVVTLWRPHWAYDEFPIKDLEDPKGTLGAAESIHTIGTTTFTKDYPALTEWIEGFKMDSELLFSLENVMFNGDASSDDYMPIVEKWITENQDYVDGLTS